MNRLSKRPWSPRKNPWSLVYTTIVFLREAALVEQREHPADAVVHGLHGRQIVLHVALVLPPDERLSPVRVTLRRRGRPSPSPA